MGTIKKQKIVDFDDLVEVIRREKQRGKKVILSHGVFDLLHPGHICHFEAAKGMADILVVTVTKDEFVNKGPGRPVFNHRLRAESIAALSAVDYVAVNKWPTAVETILHLKPDLYVKGNEYRAKGKDITGKIYDEDAAVRSVGGKLIFTDEITFSSSELLNMHFSVYPREADIFLRNFKKRYTSDAVIDILKQTKDLKVLVIGDIIIDDYVYCAGMGKPSKDDIISTKYLKEERFTGGVLAVAKHVANFCRKVHLVSVIGTRNDCEDFIRANLAPNISAKFFRRDDVPTVVKRRFLNPAFLTKIFEINYIDDTELPDPIARKVERYLETALKDYDLVIVSDFGHGFITKRIVDTICARARFLSVNTQTNSANMGYNLITKYRRADYVCIDEPEIRLAMHSKFGKLEDLVLDLRKKLCCDHIIITRGHCGALVYEKKSGFSHIPIFSKQIVDRIGAGDAFLAVTSPVVRGKNPLDVVGFIGNAVGALAVLIVGNRTPVESVPLYKFIRSLLK
ncbi:MAG: PfkB family carbohydrate kinase [Candidatus Omnitrophica bacterium]|nr:PfkB family carbohydrate kinase [Candidatus Omnitrophota bacterium]